jgi:hypothetical protein
VGPHSLGALSLTVFYGAVTASHYKDEGRTTIAVLALANAGPVCDPCGGPLKVIVQSKKGTNVLVYYR